MKKKIGILTATMVLALAATAGCSKKDDENTFTVGFDQNFPPMGYVGEDGEYTGFDIELAKEAAKRMDKEIVLQPIDWDSKDAELDTGSIDCVWNGFTMSGREDKYTWTDAYMNNSQVIVVKKDSSYEAKADLEGKTIEVQKDSSAQKAVEADEEFKKSVSVSETSDYNKGLMDLESGVVEAVVMDEIVASYYIEHESNNFRILEDKLSAEEYGIGFKKGNEELRDEVQKALMEMREDGTLEKLSTEWFGKDITTIGK